MMMVVIGDVWFKTCQKVFVVEVVNPVVATLLIDAPQIAYLGIAY